MSIAPAVLLLLLLPAGAARSAAQPASPGRAGGAARLQAIVDEFRARLAITESVAVTIVPENALLVSMQWLDDHQHGFLMSAEQGMLDGLTDDELRAIVAHELGHAWIFTHHPYLQTEQLANKIALQLVSRDSLERVYEKVWERTGTKGDIDLFLGQ